MTATTARERRQGSVVSTQKSVSMADALVLAAVLAALAATPGCSGYRQYDRAAPSLPVQADVDWGALATVGRTVRIRTSAGAMVAGKVESVSASGLQVAGVSVPYAEIRSLQVRRLLWEPTAAIAGAVAWAIVIAKRSSGTFSPGN